MVILRTRWVRMRRVVSSLDAFAPLYSLDTEPVVHILACNRNLVPQAVMTSLVRHGLIEETTAKTHFKGCLCMWKLTKRGLAAAEEIERERERERERAA